jgi:hypothetical protein
VSPETRVALIGLSVGPGIWALAQAPHAPRLALLIGALSGAVVLALARGGGRPWPVVVVLGLGAALLVRIWSGA